MKSIVKEDNKQVEYPCLMVGKESGAILLVYADSEDEYECMEGMVIVEGKLNLNVGYVSNGWRKDRFTVFKGVVELSND